MKYAVLASLALVAGCSSPARTPTNRAPRQQVYELVPLSLFGNEGRHSASHSRTSVTGSLALDGTDATLTLTLLNSTSHVRCPSSAKGVFGRQACASPDAKDTSATVAWILRGEMRTERGALVGTLRDGDKRSLALSCTPSYIGFACSVTGEAFGVRRSVPTTLAFATPSPKRFELVPLDAANVGRVAGAIEMTDARSIVVSLSVDNSPPAVLTGKVTHQDADGGGPGLLFMAQTSPTRTFSARCKISNDRLECDVTADRSVLGKPDHVMTSTVWHAKR